MNLDAIKQFLKNYDGPDCTIMEVCGTHTAAIVQNGIPSMLSPHIRLIAGPGCPVCVTVTAYIDKLVELAQDPQNVILAFGDLLRVKGSQKSLSDAKAEGCQVLMVYSPEETVELAAKDPSHTYIFAAVGFETTTPVYQVMLEEAIRRNLSNVKVLTSLKTMPQVIRWLCDANREEEQRELSARRQRQTKMEPESGTSSAETDSGKSTKSKKSSWNAITGFIAPGHVCAVTGYDEYKPIAEEYHLPFIVSGFSAEQLILTIYGLVKARGEGIVRNFYPQVVTAEGNLAAKAAVNSMFRPADAAWRGMGVVKNSGMLLRDEYRQFDAGSDDLYEDKVGNGCRCAEVLMGRIAPQECPMFGTVCTPTTPNGSCMVSQEGSCFNYFISGLRRTNS